MNATARRLARALVFSSFIWLGAAAVAKADINITTPTAGTEYSPSSGITVYGTGTPNDEIYVKLQQGDPATIYQTGTATVDGNGRWSVVLTAPANGWGCRGDVQIVASDPYSGASTNVTVTILSD